MQAVFFSWGGFHKCFEVSIFANQKLPDIVSKLTLNRFLSVQQAICSLEFLKTKFFCKLKVLNLNTLPSTGTLRWLALFKHLYIAMSNPSYVAVFIDFIFFDALFSSFDHFKIFFLLDPMWYRVFSSTVLSQSDNTVMAFLNLLRIQWKLTFAIVIRCSRLRLWEDYFIYFKFTPVLF